MRRVPWLLASVLIVPSSVWAQSYQHYADGLVAVHARQVPAGERGEGLRVCAELVREDRPGLVEIRLIFRGSGDAVLAQEAPVLRAEFGRLTCQTVSLPLEATRMSRWEIARFRLQREPSLAATPQEYSAARLTRP